MAQKVWFTNEPTVMLHIDVEGDGKQVVVRPATEQDKANYGPQFAQLQGGGTAGSATQATPGVAGQPGLAAQHAGESGTTTRDLQAAQGQPNQQPSAAPSGQVGQGQPR